MQDERHGQQHAFEAERPAGRLARGGGGTGGAPRERREGEPAGGGAKIEGRIAHFEAIQVYTNSPSAPPMLDALTQRLSSVIKTMRGHARLTEENVGEALREVRMALLEADVGLPVVKDFVARVKEKALGQEVLASLTPGQALVGVVHDELVALMGGTNAQLNLATQPPAVILLAGLQGAGKTTSAGKLARLLKGAKKKVLLVSVDIYRPAAIDQLKSLAAQLAIDLYPSDPSQKPVEIAADALDWARKHYHDVLIVDTAGRLAIDEAMMAEVKAIHAAVSPIETLFVVDSMQGQDAVNVAKAFAEALPLTGVDPHQARRRRARRRGAVGAPRHGRAHQVRRRLGEDGRPRALPPRAHGLAHPRHGRHRLARRGGEEVGRRGRGEEARRQVQEGQGLRPRRLQGADPADEEDGRRLRAHGQAPAQLSQLASRRT